MTTLVTGANGHMGENLVRALLDRGERVRTMIGPGGHDDPLSGLDVERVPGDVRDPASVRAAVDGCDRVYHLASLVSIRSGDEDRLYRINVLGTHHVVRACLDTGVQRLVHTSSIEAIGRPPEGERGTEDAPSNPYDPVTDYELSKVYSELEVLRGVVRGLDAVIVNPSAVVGPHDYKPSSIGQTIVDFAHGRIPAYISGAFDFVPMRDVVRGQIGAMERGRTGERYLLSGEVASVDQIMQWLSEMLGRPKPRVVLPAGVMLPLATFTDAVQRAVAPQRSPRFTRASIRVLLSGKHGSNDKARRELGLEPTPLREAFRESVEHMRERGLI